jgi:hypothetical protein
MFRRGIRKRKKKLYKIVSLLSSLSGITGRTCIFIWRCKVSPELKKELIELGCTIQEFKE